MPILQLLRLPVGGREEHQSERSVFKTPQKKGAVTTRRWYELAISLDRFVG